MRGFQLHFLIKEQNCIHVIQGQDWECRGQCALELLCDLADNWPELFVGKEGAISFGDWPPPPEWSERFDFSFCTVKQMGVPAPCFPFPCPMSLRWPQVGIPDAEEMLEQILADESPVEDKRIFWIGADTHASRRDLWKLGQKQPHLFDVELMEWDRSAPGGQRSKTRQVSIPEHRRFKYLIDCPGYGYSARLKWLLALGRPTFVVEREMVEHWHEEMVPWVHYVPVAADLSDLLDHHSRLEGDRDLYDEIGRNARQFAARRLRVNAQLVFTAERMMSANKMSLVR